MGFTSKMSIAWCLTIFATAALSKAQNVATVQQRSASATPTPSIHDSAPKGDNDNGADSHGLVNYYFVFIALIMCVFAFGLFIVLRRRSRAKRRSQFRQSGAIERDFGGLRANVGDGGWANWNPERRRNWQGRWRSAEVSREEGLNEHGEAPPPYIPKRRSEEEHQDDTVHDGGPAMPLQTLSREDAGLKPPDYDETHTPSLYSTTRPLTADAASPSSPRRIEP